ncbi:phage protein [Sulfuriferula multivorans]|uniref:Phage protein n=1 Tax=Sulfuriferula multivorans TaxID=1559896 RepID=A0A401JF31_9PROT|nr:hypothetical protein [Sulfuriferula multivorans]GBL46213.1 phage protein [Sulfuriferula multivorans]
MAYKTGTATSYRDLLRIVRRFVTGRAQPGTIAQTGTGNGLLTLLEPGVAAPSETWTLTCTAAAVNAGTFSVSGSVSGVQPAATVGVAYVNALLNFTITDGTVDFIVGDQFVVAVVASGMIAGERWVDDRWIDGATTQEWLTHAPGLAGTDAIYGGVYSSQDSGAPYYRWQIGANIGYVGGNDFFSQPGRLPAGQNFPGVTLANTAMPYWLVASGRRLVLVAKVGTVYEAMYLGFILPYATPGQYPYPLFVGGSLTGSAGWLSSLTGPDHRHFVDPGNFTSSSTSSMSRLRDTSGRWAIFMNRSGTSEIYTTDTGSTSYYDGSLPALREALTGEYALLPISLKETYLGISNVYGEFDGCYWISGFGNAAENTITIGADNYLVVQNVYRVGVADFWALKLA